MAILEGRIDGHGLKLVVVVSRFNSLITEALLAAAIATWKRFAVAAEDIDVVYVPGAFELPVTAKWLAQSERYDAVLCLAAVIRGETPHFDYVATQAASGVLQVAMQSSLPVIFGVLTCDNIEQALDRAGLKAGNKGADGALAALEMVQLRKQLALHLQA